MSDSDCLYSSWSASNGANINESEIYSIFQELGLYYGFQEDNVSNMYHLFMSQLNSRAHRMECSQALKSLYSDYIAGEHSNYRKWFFATRYVVKKEDLVYQWKLRISTLGVYNYVLEIALYLLIWGEANNIRFMPECICFIYYCAISSFPNHFKNSVHSQDFLSNVINPFYNVLMDQKSRSIKGKDHASVIGYDDINQFFWNSYNLRKIQLQDGSLFMDLPKCERYFSFSKIDWNNTFFKTYKERRSWFHLLTNFTRIWNIHVSTYWYFTSFNSPTLYTKNYIQLLDNKPPLQVKLTIVSFGGSLACLLQILATMCEFLYVKVTGKLFLRLALLIFLFLVNIAPSIYILVFIPFDVYSVSGLTISVIQLIFSIFTTIYLSVVPSNKLFCIKNNETITTFTSSFAPMGKSQRTTSIVLWLTIFTAKFLESYFFLTLALKDSIRVLYTLKVPSCYGDVLTGSLLCRHYPKFLLFLVYMVDLILFFLDTYLWYVICNCLLSTILSFESFQSIFSPWKSISRTLPSKLGSNFINQSGPVKLDISKSISKIWNSIMFSMYREHFLSLDQIRKLVYHYSESDFIQIENPPLFFVLQDHSNKQVFFDKGKEAERRILYFTQSLSMNMPEPIPINALPQFTVLVPHFSEKILLSTDYILKADKKSKISPLEYLKKLHKQEWEYFVSDTKIMDSYGEVLNEQILNKSPNDEELDDEILNDKLNDNIPYYCVGFKRSSYANTLRTRIWASLRTQTLYRTISGFANYYKAIQLLYDSEELNYNSNNNCSNPCRIVIAIQRLQFLTKEELEDASFLFAAFPEILVATIEQEYDDLGNLIYYSSLLDVSKKTDSGKFSHIYKIRLSGNPIIGDGKSDNQNNSLIFYRGEYIQVVDSNQDNYLEECLKIKSVLAEFEEYDLDCSNDYDPSIPYSDSSKVAILGAREYIFSENEGILGDVAASKEQTFGTLFARSLVRIGGKLHYGHPDFMNGIFMCTRGGISKGQKGLHLNEDIFAGMNTILRGGRIKHCDYYQCGKGRDLGFGSVLNFTRKIGAGMGEQILSREHYYLGTSLSIDRLLTFYYAHAGFHINNLLIMLSVHMFMLILMNFGALSSESIICQWKQGDPVTNLEVPLGCSNLLPINYWIKHYVLSVVICFIISFIPMVVQQLLDKGPFFALKKIFIHIFSLSPFFEVVVCQIFAKSLRDNLTYGGAKYFATGRGFSTTRNSFSNLYSQYANDLIYIGGMWGLVLIFATITIWQPSLLWFWVTIISLLLAPFLFNPHQFSWQEFFLDYREFLRWLSRGNYKDHTNSWVNFTKEKRSKFSGYSRRKLNESESENIDLSSHWNVFLDQVLFPFFNSFFFLLPYLFINSQHGVTNPEKIHVLLRLGLVLTIPILLKILLLSLLGIFSIFFGLFCNPAIVISAIAHSFAIIITFMEFILIFALEGENFSRGLAFLVCIINLKKLIFQSTSWLLASELIKNNTNRTWWSGKFWKSGLGFTMFLPYMIREFFIKIIELDLFALDFIYGHLLFIIMLPFVVVPYFDRLHTVILLWIGPRFKPLPNIFGRRELKRRRKRIYIHFFVLSVLVIVFMASICLPILMENYLVQLTTSIKSQLPLIGQIIQPSHQNNNYTGENAQAYVLKSTPELIDMKTIF